MIMTPEETAIIRNKLYPLKVDQSSEDRFLYEKWRAIYIQNAEGSVPFSYKDVLGLVTVGIGFNMDRDASRSEWEEAFNGVVDFDEVYHQKRHLSPEEIEQLFKSGLQIREKSLSESYREIWPHLRANERLATESAYYNGECLVKGPERDAFGNILRQGLMPLGSTRYYAALERYILENTLDSLHQAITELRDHSNRRKIHGLTLRRASEAELLCSFKVPGFLAAA
jgi:hypothetical protein